MRPEPLPTGLPPDITTVRNHFKAWHFSTLYTGLLWGFKNLRTQAKFSSISWVGPQLPS